MSNMILSNRTLSRICGRAECKCCHGGFKTGAGIKSTRRAAKRRERQTVNKMIHKGEF